MQRCQRWQRCWKLRLVSFHFKINLTMLLTWSMMLRIAGESILVTNVSILVITSSVSTRNFVFLNIKNKDCNIPHSIHASKSQPTRDDKLDIINQLTLDGQTIIFNCIWYKRIFLFLVNFSMQKTIGFLIGNQEKLDTISHSRTSYKNATNENIAVFDEYWVFPAGQDLMFNTFQYKEKYFFHFLSNWRMTYCIRKHP